MCAIVATVGACDSPRSDAPERAASGPTPSVSAAAAAASAPRPPTQPTSVKIDSHGYQLHGEVWIAAEAAPLVVLVHRFRGNSKEWAPLIERLSRAKRRYSILAFDQRGHGQSRAAPDGGRLDWGDMGRRHVAPLRRDVVAATRYAVERLEPPSVVFVGSSLGAALAASVAGDEPLAAGVGLVSPGASIMGFGVYEPFARVRALPSFVASAERDFVSRDPAAKLLEMAGSAATERRYEGQGHGAQGLAMAHGAFWGDLEAWLMQVYPARPPPRPVLQADAGPEKR